MKNKILASLFALAIASPAMANWERSAPYGTGYYSDSGSRFTVSLRGGATFGMGKMQNELGALVPEPFWEGPAGEIVGESYCGGSPSACQGAGFTSIGSIDIANLGVKKNLSSFTWTSAIAIGMTLPNSPQWRVEAGWDHIGQSDYDSIPLFEGTAVTENGIGLFVQSGGVKSTVETDIFSVMMYYDFYDGCSGPKASCKIIPYVGFGLGYATSITVMSLTDIYGDLSSQAAMQYFGEDDGTGTLNFFTSEKRMGNFAASLAAGLSYGLTHNMYLDVGFRLNYIPSIKWELNNVADTSAITKRSKDMFSAKNIIYGSFLVGVRFEF